MPHKRTSVQYGIGRTTKVGIVIVVLVASIAIAGAFSSQSPNTTTPGQTTLSTSQTSSSATQSSQLSSTSQTSSSTAQSSFSGAATCVFSSPQQAVQASGAETLTFQGCLTAGKSGSYQIAVVNQAGLTLSGAVTAKYPIQVTISGGGETLYTMNGKASASFSGLSLDPQTGYMIIIKNLGGQNNSLSMNLQLT